MAVRDKRGRFTAKRRITRDHDGRFETPRSVYRALPDNDTTAEQRADPTYRRAIRTYLGATESYDAARNKERELIAFFETVEGKRVTRQDLRRMGLGD